MKLSRPPIPHEHGAWVVLYAPFAIGLAGAGRVSSLPTLLLLLAVTGLYFARNAAGLWMRRRKAEGGLAAWLAIFVTVFAASSATLLIGYRCDALLQVGAAAAGLFIAHALLSIWPARRRLDRSRSGEVIGMAALSLTAPAAYAVGAGRLDRSAWLAWALCTLFFASSVFVVKMLLEAVKRRSDWSDRVRLRIGRDTLIYHTLLIPIVAILAAGLGAAGKVLLAAAFIPIILRAMAAIARLSPALPPLKRVGLLEVCYSLWFTGCLIAVHFVEHS